MAKQDFTFPPLGTDGRDRVLIMGDFTLGSSGAIASTTGYFSSQAAGVLGGIVKTATKTGRYTCLLKRKWKNCRVLAITLTGPADAAITTATANHAFVRNVSHNGFDIQLCIGLNAGGTTDTDGMSGLVVTYVVELRRN